MENEPSYDDEDMSMISDILNKNISEPSFLLHYIFSPNQAAKAEMVGMAMIAFDEHKYMSKWLKRVNILADKNLIEFYDYICGLVRTWRPNIDNFEVPRANFEKYEKLNETLKYLLMHI